MREFKIKEKDFKENTALEKLLNVDRLRTEVNKKSKKHQKCVCVCVCVCVYTTF